MSGSKAESLLLVLACCLAQVPLLALASAPAQAQTSGLDLNYTVTVQKEQPYAHIRLEISGITSSSITLTFRGEALYVEDYVHNMSATSEGRSLTITDQGQGIWKVDSVGSSLTLEYDIEKVVPSTELFGENLTSIYIDNETCVIMPSFFFIYPDVDDANSIRIKFDVPADWTVITPYPLEGDHFEVQRITRSLVTDFLGRHVIYMGKMKFYSERQLGNCTIKFGVLETDHNYIVERFKTQADVEKTMDSIAKCLESVTNLFGENLFKIFIIYPQFSLTSEGSSNVFRFPSSSYMGNCYPLWGESQWDIEIGHMMFAYIAIGNPDRLTLCSAPVPATDAIHLGFEEYYYGQVLAWRIFKDPIYLGKLYYWYLIYERFLQTNWSSNYWFEAYIKTPFVAHMLDKEIQNATNGTKSLDDVMKYLYSTYKNAGHIVDFHDLEAAVENVTGKDFSDLFSRYVYGNEEIPHQYIQNYKPYFVNDFPQRFEDTYGTGFPHLYGHTIPFFINIEMILYQGVEQGTGGKVVGQPVCNNALFWMTRNIENFADYTLSHYTIDNLTEKDVEDALSALTGADCSGFFTRWENSYGRLSLGEVKEWLRDYSEGQEGGETPGEGGRPGQEPGEEGPSFPVAALVGAVVAIGACSIAIFYALKLRKG
jgi:hypothetical protein